jgi:hypothetical protein
MLKIIFCGDRNWNDRRVIAQVMRAIYDNIGPFTVIEGEAQGADSISRSVAELTFELPVIPVPAEWNLHGRAAGPIRNTRMLIEKKAHATVAFHLDIAHSKGTADMVRQTRKAGRPCWICTDGDKALMDFILELRRIQNDEISTAKVG